MNEQNKLADAAISCNEDCLFGACSHLKMNSERSTLVDTAKEFIKNATDDRRYFKTTSDEDAFFQIMADFTSEQTASLRAANLELEEKVRQLVIENSQLKSMVKYPEIYSG